MARRSAWKRSTSRPGNIARSRQPRLESVEAASGGLRALMEHPDKGGQYAWRVLSRTLSYAADAGAARSPTTSPPVDQAMRLGFNWKYGPFELIDRMGAK